MRHGSDRYVDAGGITRADAGAPDPANPPTMSDDAYPKVIADQREMLWGAHGAETAEDVFWHSWALFLARNHKTIVLDRDHELTPRINHSRWLADCPTDTCAGGIALWDRNPYGCCLDCGVMFPVTWQAPSLRAAVIRLLAGRPPTRRNWDGETIEELIIQNVLMQGVEPEQRNGLLVAAGVHMPDELTNHQDYLEQLRVARQQGRP